MSKQVPVYLDEQELLKLVKDLFFVENQGQRETSDITLEKFNVKLDEFKKQKANAELLNDYDKK